MPRSKFLLALVSVFFIVSYTLQFMFNDSLEFLSLPIAFYRCCVLFLCIALFCFMVLFLRGLSSRYLQTLASLLGSQCLINLFVLPLLLLAPYVLIENPTGLLVFVLGVFFLLTIIALNVWHLLVNAFILQQSLDIGYLLALLVSFSNMGFSLLVYSHLT